MGWKLWLDDERPCPHVSDDMLFAGERDWVVAKSTKEAIKLVNTLGPPEFMSLDHDLGGDDTAMDFVKWLSEEHFKRMPLWRIHSQNPVGKANLEAFMRSWARASE